jgi:4'-phosphopantetheinyl transferase EntD
MTQPPELASASEEDPIRKGFSQLPLEDLFQNAEVAIARETISLSREPLCAGEASFVQRAVPKRQAEFAAGRACARRALFQFQQESVSIPVGADRAPVWPVGYLGSISHSGDHCAAVVARSSTSMGLGLDIENDAPLEPRISARIQSTGDAALGWYGSQDSLAKYLFVVKECLYKAQYTVTKTFLDFLDVHVELDFHISRFRILRITKPDPLFGRFAACEGHFTQTQGWIAAGIALPAPARFFAR